mmetsp:Transcript_17614/g.29740  ORF Transcript_17614/g.29740 Transcript_17614/m.29740 type:complete len:215 (+) Transcript_17614:113-757(+)
MQFQSLNLKVKNCIIVEQSQQLGYNLLSEGVVNLDQVFVFIELSLPQFKRYFRRIPVKSREEEVDTLTTALKELQDILQAQVMELDGELEEARDTIIVDLLQIVELAVQEFEDSEQPVIELPNEEQALVEMSEQESAGVFEQSLSVARVKQLQGDLGEEVTKWEKSFFRKGLIIVRLKRYLPSLLGLNRYMFKTRIIANIQGPALLAERLLSIF